MSRHFQGMTVEKMPRVSLVFVNTSFYTLFSSFTSSPHNIYLGVVDLERAVVMLEVTVKSVSVDERMRATGELRTANHPDE